jgi:SAM-dependent methyltransferase
VPSIHRAAGVGFDIGADAYERGRPGFPDEAVERLAEELRIGPGARVVDLAAGTGKLTRVLVPFGANLLAVEPVEGMRRAFRELLPDVPMVGGLAEALPFRTGSLDAVSVAQAFHWFDAEAALAELHRVLVPGGRLGLVWNVRVESSPISASLTALFDRYREGAPAFRDRAWEPAFAATELFSPLRTVAFDHKQRLTVEGFLDRARSVSFIAALDPDEAASVHRELLALVPPDATEMMLPYRCEVSWCERSA